MKNATRLTLSALALIGLTFAPGASGQTRDWPWLGVLITDADRAKVEGYYGGGIGSFVTGVEYTGPASAAGLRRYDIIIAVDGQTALNTRELTCIIQGKRPGDVVLVTVVRGGGQHAIPVRLGHWPEGKEFPRPLSGHCGLDAVSGLPVAQRSAALSDRRINTAATSAGTPNTIARNGNSPITE